MSLAPDLAARLAKLLRTICDRSFDGETIAAASRLSAISAAHDVDWDLALNGSGGSALSEEQMHRIYSEGYQRGLVEGQQQIRPERDWTPASGTSAEAGSDAERIETILNAASQSNGLLTDWERDWCEIVRERFARYRNRLYVSEKMWAIFDRLETKMRRAGTL